MSSERAKSFHSITIGGKNTWDDWHLVPASRPAVKPPSVRTSFVDIPGGIGSLDLTEALVGRPTFGTRQGSWEFIVMHNGIDPLAEADYGEWQDRYSELLSFLHGRAYKCVLDDDPDWYYEGRFSLSDWRTEQVYSTITINYVLQPYKKSVNLVGDDWLWDPFSFLDGVIVNYRNLTVVGTLTVTVVGDGSLACPSIISSANGITLTAGGHTYTLVAGTNRFADLVIQEGDNSFVFSGNGVVSIEDTGGRL